MKQVKMIISGGARGCDSIFNIIGEERKVNVFNISFESHKMGTTLGKRVNVPDEILMSKIEELDKICFNLHRKMTHIPYVKKLLLRDFFQVKGLKGNVTDLVIAGAYIQENGYSVDGGTAYALEYAKTLKVNIILYNLSDDKFYAYSYKKREYIRITQDILLKIKKILPDNFILTGIGSRDVYDCGLVKEEFNKMLNYLLK